MIYVVDTNILSEVFKPKPRYNVICWMQDHNEEIHLNAVTLHEIHYGIALMPDGKKKAGYLETIDAVSKECVNRILSFDAFSGYLCGINYAHARRMGRQGSIEDCMIAAICQRNDATLVTHNVKDFECFDIPIVDPFDYESPVLAELKRREADRS